MASAFFTSFASASRGSLCGIIPQVILSEELDYSKGGITENVIEPANWVVVLNGCCCQFGVQKVSVLL